MAGIRKQYGKSHQLTLVKKKLQSKADTDHRVKPLWGWQRSQNDRRLCAFRDKGDAV